MLLDDLITLSLSVSLDCSTCDTQDVVGGGTALDERHWNHDMFCELYFDDALWVYMI